MHLDLQAARLQKLWENHPWVVALYCAQIYFVHFCVKTVYFIAANLATFKLLLLTRDIKVPCSN